MVVISYIFFVQTVFNNDAVVMVYTMVYTRDYIPAPLPYKRKNHVQEHRAAISQISKTELDTPELYR